MIILVLWLWGMILGVFCVFVFLHQRFLQPVENFADFACKINNLGAI